MAYVRPVDASESVIKCWVPGPPASKGSFVGLWSERDRRVVFKGGSRAAQWQRDVAIVFKGSMNAAHASMQPAGTPVRLVLVFHIDGQADTPGEPYVRKPDIDKLQRAVLDALTGVLYADDQQVYRVAAEKRHAQPAGFGVSGPGVYIEAAIESRQQQSAPGEPEGQNPQGAERRTRRRRSATDHGHVRHRGAA